MTNQNYSIQKDRVMAIICSIHRKYLVNSEAACSCNARRNSQGMARHFRLITRVHEQIRAYISSNFDSMAGIPSYCTHISETEMTVTVSLNEFASSVGRKIEPSDWLLIDQERVNQFASATNDHQYIHVDPDRAAQSPFGGTIAHGFLTLSLLSHLNTQNLIVPEGLEMIINYGSNKIRYLQPVCVGERIRSHQKFLEVSQRNPGQWMVKNMVTVEIKNKEKSAMIAEILSLFLVQ